MAESWKAVARVISSDFYFTLLSIIQGITLGTLVQKLNAMVHARGGLLPLSLFSTVVVGVTGLLLVIYVWFEYAKSAVTFGWPPTWITSALPFAVGFCESVFILLASRPPLYLAAFAALAALAAGEHLDMSRTLDSARLQPRILRYQQVLQPRLAVVFLVVSGCSLGAALLTLEVSSPAVGAALLLLPLAVLAALNVQSSRDWQQLKVLAAEGAEDASAA